MVDEFLTTGDRCARDIVLAQDPQPFFTRLGDDDSGDFLGEFIAVLGRDAPRRAFVAGISYPFQFFNRKTEFVPEGGDSRTRRTSQSS